MVIKMVKIISCLQSKKITIVKTFMDACNVYLVDNTAVILRGVSVPASVSILLVWSQVTPRSPLLRAVSLVSANCGQYPVSLLK